jgi:uncharacterized DUF497 family protein
VRIEALEISDTVLEKIESKHGVTFEECEEAVQSGERHVRRGRDGLYKTFSRTAAGRYVLVVLAAREAGLFAIVTARDMSETERRLYRRAKGA